MKSCGGCAERGMHASAAGKAVLRGAWPQAAQHAQAFTTSARTDIARAVQAAAQAVKSSIGQRR